MKAESHRQESFSMIGDQVVEVASTLHRLDTQAYAEAVSASTQGVDTMAGYNRRQLTRYDRFGNRLDEVAPVDEGVSMGSSSTHEVPKKESVGYEVDVNDGTLERENEEEVTELMPARKEVALGHINLARAILRSNKKPK